MQSGSFEAFIPNGAMEAMWHIHPSAFVADMDERGKGHSRVTRTVTALPDGVLLTYSGFNYSTEDISIEPDTTPVVPPSAGDVAPAPAPSYPVAPTGTGDAFTSLVVMKDVDSSGSNISADAGDSQIQIQVPAGAFATPQAITLTSGLATDAGAVFNRTDYSGYVPTATFGVNFSGDNPTVPITVNIHNADIPVNAKVFKVNSDGTLQPVDATVEKGMATITFSNDPDFVIAVPPTTPGNSGAGKGVMINGALQSVPSIVRYRTTYMPIWYLQQALDKLGMTGAWNGKSWTFTTSLPVNLDSIHAGYGDTGIYINGHLVQKVTKVVAVDPYSKKLTTYVPIWYLEHVLDRVGFTSTWDGKVWRINEK